MLIGTFIKKYLFTAKSYAIINIISLISVIGVAVGTMALFVVLSVFNGFENIIVKLINNFQPDLRIESVYGKTIDLSTFPYDKLTDIQNVKQITLVIEDIGLARYNNKQQIVIIKGVSDNFLQKSSLDSIIIEGTPVLKQGEQKFALIGTGVEYILGINLKDNTQPLALYTPRRTAKGKGIITDLFNTDFVYPSAVFSVQQEYDENYIIVSLETAKKLYEYENQVSAIEISTTDGASVNTVREQIKVLLGHNFHVKDRFMQQETIYKILNSEKLAIFIILLFILLVATFNVIGTTGMIILEKRSDIAIIHALGGNLRFIRKIFITEGLFIILSGAVIGLIAGGIICYLQQTFGFIKLGNEGDFIVQSYPVKVRLTDILYILVSVFGIGIITSWIPSAKINTSFTKIRNEE